MSTTSSSRRKEVRYARKAGLHAAVRRMPSALATDVLTGLTGRLLSSRRLRETRQDHRCRLRQRCAVFVGMFFLCFLGLAPPVPVSDKVPTIVVFSWSAQALPRRAECSTCPSLPLPTPRWPAGLTRTPGSTPRAAFAALPTLERFLQGD